MAWAVVKPMAALQWLSALPAEQPNRASGQGFPSLLRRPGIARMLRNLNGSSLRSTPHTLVITAAEHGLPRDLEEASPCWICRCRKQQDLRQLLNSRHQQRTPLGAWPAGGTHPGLQRAQRDACSPGGRTGPGTPRPAGAEDLDEVLEEKRQTIARSEVLEFCNRKPRHRSDRRTRCPEAWLEQRHHGLFRGSTPLRTASAAGGAPGGSLRGPANR